MKKRIKLTESDLHRIVRESVRKVVNEENDSYYGGGLPDSYYKYDGDESPNEYDDFEGTPAWNAIDSILTQNGFNGDLDYNQVQALRQLTKPLQKLDKCMEDATREVIRVSDGKQRLIQQDDIINFIKESLPNYYNFIHTLHGLYRDFKWMIRK